MAPAFTTVGDAARDPDPLVRRVIERYALGPHDPWALVQAIRGVGRACRINGESAAGDVLRPCVRAQEVNTRRYLYLDFVHLMETGRQEEGGIWLSRKPPDARSFRGQCMWLRQS
jgi:hypothetical protein